MWIEGWLTTDAKIAMESFRNATYGLTGAKFATGNAGHRMRMDWNDVPSTRAASSVAISQWCSPFRRQHCGRFESSTANAGVARVEKQIASNNEIADARRTASWYFARHQLASDFSRSAVRTRAYENARPS